MARTSEFKSLTRTLLHSDGLLAQAERALQRLVAADPSDAALLLRLGDMQRGLGKLQDALESYRRATSLRPDDRKASWLVAVLSGRASSDAPPAAAPVPFVYRPGFLGPRKARELLALALASRDRFHVASVTSVRSGSPHAIEKVAPDRRNALAGDDRFIRDEVRPWFETPLRAAFANALPRLQVREPSKYSVEMGISVHVGGGFFSKHRDSGGAHSNRLVSFAYYFHRQPRRFSGGDLLLYDGDGDDGVQAFTRIEPHHNSIVFFPASCLHRITRVTSIDCGFGDARFAVHGWLRTGAAGGANPSR